MKKRSILSGLASIIIGFAGGCNVGAGDTESICYEDHSIRDNEGLVWIDYDGLTINKQERKFYDFCEQYGKGGK